MPRSLMEKANSMQEQMGSVNQRDVNSEKDPKRKKSRDQKDSNRSKECLWLACWTQLRK